MRVALCTALLLPVVSLTAMCQEALPAQIAGSWRITRVLPVRGPACWTESQAQALVGSRLEYGASSMRWKGGAVPLTGVTTRSVTSEDLAGESKSPLTLTDLGIRASGVTEVNLQHEDADITGATTEVPGDSVLIAGPGRIVVSACGVYLEARRPVARAAPEGTRKGM